MIWKIIASRTGADSSDKPKRAGNTVHLYVASIFKDFVQEREFLASHVFPELAYWCSNHQLNFLPVDLRYDLTHSADTVQFTATCLQEIDRLVEDGVPVCFLAFLSEQVGYIPSSEMAPSLGCTDWIDGISLLEMEIVKGAFFASNPNALFLCRDPSSLAQLPPDIASKYQPANSSEAARMDFLKSKLLSKYPEQVYSYTTNTSYSAVTGDVKFGGFESFVSKVVLDFFQLRIKSEFMVSPTPVLNPLECIEYHQQKDLTSRTKAPLVGKQQLVDKIKHYIEDPFNNAPLLILGDLGSGKTTVLAHMAAHYKDKYSTARKEQQLLQIQFDAQQEQARHDNAMRMERTDKRRFSVIGNLLSQKSSETWYNGELTNRGTSSFSHKRLRRISEHSRPRRMVHDDSCINHETPLEEHGEEYFDLNYPSAKITSRTDSEWQVFYHSVGSHPLSRELRYILQRLWRVEGLGEPRMTDMPSDCNALANKIREMLSTCGQKRFLLFLDSIDKIRGEFSSNVLKWIPSKLPSNVRIVTSLYSGSEVRKVLTSREPKCLELTNGSPSLAQSKVLLRSGLEHAGIMENPDLMEVLLNKHGIGNPLYITELCGELSRLDTTHTSSGWVVEKAKVLPNDLPGLYNHVLSAVEESLGRAGIAVLCLLYCSRCGLTEVELLEMLGTLEESNEQGNQIEDPQWSGLIGDESGLMGSQRFGASDISSWSASDVERTSLCESNASGNVIKSRKPSVELHLPLHGPPLPGSAARLSPWINHRKISSCSSGSAPEHTHTHPHSPLLLPSTPDFSRFGATPPGSLRRRHSRPSPSLTPVSSRLSPIFGHRNPTIDLHIDKEQLPPAEIEEASTDSRQKSSKSSHTDNPSPVKLTKRMSALRWATVYRTLKPFITNIGGPAETKWVLSNQSFSKAVYKKYFKNPPISSFPFSFSSFCGAYNDTIHHYFRKKKSGDPSTRLHASPGDTDMLSADLLLKRSLWWHSRLVWYFQSYCTDPRRRGEELPYHLVQLQNTNKLTKCLSSVEIFRSLSLPQKASISCVCMLWSFFTVCFNFL
jgi:DNA polymerase III delta prime subunit